MGGGPEAIILQQPIIGRTRRSDLYSEIMKKRYRPVFGKGRLLTDMVAAPYGWRGIGFRDDGDAEPLINEPMDSDIPCCSNTIV